MNDLEKLKQSILDIADAHAPDAGDREFEIIPVSPITFIESSEYYYDRGEVWDDVKHNLEKIFSGPNFSPAYRTVVFVGGSGCGKTTLMSLMLAYSVYWLHCLKYPAKYFGLERDSQIALMNMAPSAENATRILFTDLKEVFNRCKIFTKMRWYPAQYRRELRFEKKRILLASGSSSEKFPLGANLYGGVIDEAAFFETQSGRDKCEEIYDILDSRRYSRFKDNGLIAMVTTGGSETCFVERKFEESERNTNILALRRSKYKVDPRLSDLPTFPLVVTRIKPSGYTETLTLNPPLALKDQYDRNLSKALRDVDGIPSTAIQPFFMEWERIIGGANRLRPDPLPDTGDNVFESHDQMWRRLPDDFKGLPSVGYYIHIDIGSGDVSSGKCAAGFAMAHKVASEGSPKAQLDLCTRFKSPPGQYVSLSGIRQFISDLQNNRGFYIAKVTFDRHQSADSVEILRSQGIASDIYSVGYKEYEIVRAAMFEGRVDYFYDMELLRELKALEDKVTTIVPGVGALKDEADAFAGAVSAALLSTGTGFEKKKVRARVPVFVPRLLSPSFQMGSLSGSPWRRF
jgi:hypothetical protein